MPLNKDLREFVELLNSNGVEYLVVGDFAVAFHGYPRYTADLDLLIRPTAENAVRTIETLHEFGFASLGIGLQDLDSPGKVVQLGVKPNRIDLITSLSGVTFEEAWRARVAGDMEDVATQFSGANELLRNKESTRRARISVMPKS
jgi:hypothetical protein